VRATAAELLAAALVTPVVGTKPSAPLREALEAAYPAANPMVRLALNLDPQKGLCVSSACHIPEGAFVLEYAGDLLTQEESVAAEERYYSEYSIDAVGCFMFWFQFKRKTYCIDSTCPAPNMQPGAKLPQHLNPGLPLQLPKVQAPVANNSAVAAPSAAIEEATAVPMQTEEKSTPAPSPSSLSASSSPPVAPAPSSTSAVVPAASIPTTVLSLPVPPPAAASSSSSFPSGRLMSAAGGVSSDRLETLGYGIARYINHSRTPNLFVRVLDCPSKHIRTSRFDGSVQDDERKEHIKRVQAANQADKLAAKMQHHSSNGNGHAHASSNGQLHVSSSATAMQTDDDAFEEERKDGGGTQPRPHASAGASSAAAASVAASSADSVASAAAATAPEASNGTAARASTPSGSGGQSSVPLNLHRSYPRLCFFAQRPILRGEELTIDYGDRDKESIEQFPWLARSD
jgi:hypothetical protein